MSLTGFEIATDEPPVAESGVWLACIGCGVTLAPFDDVVYTCPTCDGLLEVRYRDLAPLDSFIGADSDGVWRFSEVLPLKREISLDEGDTPLYDLPEVAESIGVASLQVKHEGMNPTGSFKDRGMTVGVGVANHLGIDRLVCASTGNTSASLAAYGGRAGKETLVLLPAGKVAAGKLAQASLHGARILEVDGNFDACLDLVQRLAEDGEAYLLNSVNPFRLEGQKTIAFEILLSCFERDGVLPDRICLPVGNAGNTAALYKAFRELVTAGSVDPASIPKLTAVQAAGAAPFVKAVEAGSDAVDRWDTVETTATAIRIGYPVNAPKALPGIVATDGTAIAVEDSEISEAQRELAEAGIGVEPASAASLAGLKRLRREGVVDASERVVCLTTGHLLKDPDAAANAGRRPEAVPDDYEAILQHLQE